MHVRTQISATRFARKKMVLRVIDDIHFFCPILVGDRVNIESQVNRVFNQSMEVGVRLYKLELSGRWRHICITFINAVKCVYVNPLTPIDVQNIFFYAPNIDEYAFVGVYMYVHMNHSSVAHCQPF